jgi:hypothetical protein
MKAWHAYAGTSEPVSVFVPDTKILEDKPSYFAFPLRGHGYTLAVYDREKDKIIGWIETEALGYKTAKEFMKSAHYHPEKIPAAYR